MNIPEVLAVETGGTATSSGGTKKSRRRKSNSRTRRKSNRTRRVRRKSNRIRRKTNRQKGGAGKKDWIYKNERVGEFIAMVLIEEPVTVSGDKSSIYVCDVNSHLSKKTNFQDGILVVGKEKIHIAFFKRTSYTYDSYAWSEVNKFRLDLSDGSIKIYLNREVGGGP